MYKARFAAALLAVIAAAGCTPGSATGGSGGGVALGAVIIHISLLNFAPHGSQYGIVAGYSPNPLIVSVGSTVQFVNDDNFTHTASSVGQSGFPPGNPLNQQALNQSGTDLGQLKWSSGALAGGTPSQVFTASVPGTYYFGCYFHYPEPMRGVIIVQ
ncbi:MAG TPA: plastocyanin/azurin family copper-binding protein [Candidatus Eremiobacteraceae bacterium]|nr:plastocyanin/azurin family copper-binding protein [Candidatus Eremiobacteraceae bacterium]